MRLLMSARSTDRAESMHRTAVPNNRSDGRDASNHRHYKATTEGHGEPKRGGRPLLCGQLSKDMSEDTANHLSRPHSHPFQGVSSRRFKSSLAVQTR